MSPSPKKAERQSQQREGILTAASQCISETSLLNFKMASVASAAGVSMGTIYKHVQSKEDVLIALAVESFKHLYRCYEEVLRFPISTPLRLVSLFLVTPSKLRLYEFSTHLEMLVTNRAVLDNASSLWVDRMVGTEGTLVKLFTDLSHEACKTGEFKAKTKKETELLSVEMMTGLWALHSGFEWVSYQQKIQDGGGDPSDSVQTIPLTDPIVRSAIRLLNSYPWQTKISDTDLTKACKLLEKKGYR